MSALRLFPPAPCVLCGKRPGREENGLLCPDCVPKLREMRETPCRQCGYPAAFCICFSDPAVKFPFWYENPSVRRLVDRLKHNARAREVRFLASEMASLCGTEPSGIRSGERIGDRIVEKFDAVTFVPRREREVRRYGYDHARLLAKALAEELGLPLAATLRCRPGPEQKALTAKQREELIKGCFLVLPHTLRGAPRLLLADDLTTTGATLRETSRLLREAGAASVTCIALCRASV